MQKFDKKVSVIFPAYNEEENIELCVVRAHDVLGRLTADFEIIVVDDGSSDRTGEIGLELAGRLGNIRVISKEKNEDYGFALRDGFKAARFELVFFSDSDGQFDIDDLAGLLRHIDDHDIVIGYRKNRRDPFRRKVTSFFYNMLIKAFFRLHVKDVNCAFKLFRKEVLDNIAVESRRYFVNTEILAKARARGATIKEVPVSHFPRHAGKSKVGYSDVAKTVKEIMRFYGDDRFFRNR